MTAVVVDTQAVIWMLSETASLSAQAKGALVAAEADGGVYVSVITIVEITYLAEKGRMTEAAAATVIGWLLDEESTSVIVGVDVNIATRLAALPRDHVLDMPDRIIGATALHLGLRLVTSDRQLRDSIVPTI